MATLARARGRHGSFRNLKLGASENVKERLGLRGGLVVGGFCGVSLPSTSGIFCNTESRLRFLWCDPLYGMDGRGGNTIPIDLQVRVNSC